MEKCPHCAGRLAPSRQRQAHRISGRSFTVTIGASACQKCEMVLLSARSVERAHLEIASELALYGPLGGEAFRFIRKTLGLSAVAIAGLLDVTPETISRWENGQRPLDRGAWLTVGTLSLERAGRSTDTMARINLLRVASTVKHGPLKIDASRDSGVRRSRLKAAKA